MTLLVLQTEVHPQDYLSRETFRKRVFSLLEEGFKGEEAPRLAAFPEAFALPLLFYFEAEPVLEVQTLSQALLYHLREGPLFPWKRAQKAFYLWQAVFREAARAFKAYILAGSLLTPLYDEELSRGQFMRGVWFYNLALFLNPKGQVLARIPKMHLTHEERFLRRGGFGPHLVQTGRGRLGVLICLDAFFQSHVERLDAQGAELLLVPSANPAPWDRPWPKDPARKEGEVWVEAMANRLLGRENLRLLLNPMLNGRFLGLVFEGQSGVYAQGQPLKLAGSPRGDDFLEVFWE